MSTTSIIYLQPLPDYVEKLSGTQHTLSMIHIRSTVLVAVYVPCEFWQNFCKNVSVVVQ